jgi:ectoine hydroxylase-related dioxygenase (phytanoyl-CoA dioxygenase family)
MSSNATLARLPADADPVDVQAALLADGAVIVERLVSQSVVDQVRGELQPYIDATPMGPDSFSGRNTRRTGSLLVRSTASHDLIANPLVLSVCDGVLGVNATNYQLHLTQVIDIGPGEPAQFLHRDQWAWDRFPFPAGFEVEISTIWAMQDFTDEVGATRVIPGSHRWEPDRVGRPEETVPAEMPCGSVLLYTGSVIHGGGANRSGIRRMAVNVDYCLGWLRQEENQYLACPPDRAAALPEALLRLAGYARGAYALGYFGDTQDPLEAVRPDLATGHGLS